MSATVELVAGPLRALARSTAAWSIGLGLLIVATVAFWPAFQGSALSDVLDQFPPGVVEALGLADIGTPAGYLRGNLYELIVPLLLAMAAVALVNGQTAAEEASGRLELFLAQPVGRVPLFLGRAAAALLALVTIGVLVAIVQFASNAVVDLDADAGRVAVTIALAVLLGAFHGGLALALAGLGLRPALVLGLGIGLALAGYFVAALFPLSDVLEPWRVVSPWEWALGGDPLVNGAEPWRLAVLGLPAIGLALAGAWAFSRRDVAAA